jgi:hypothetical protein
MLRPHPQFSPRTYENDVALILLDRPSAKRPIGLPAASTAPAAPPGQVLTAIGWGLLRQGGPTATTLQQVRCARYGWQSIHCWICWVWVGVMLLYREGVLALGLGLGEQQHALERAPSSSFSAWTCRLATALLPAPTYSFPTHFLIARRWG